MHTYIGLLRGINVSGHKKIKMADLREQLGELALEGIRTYIQSGNLIFQSPEQNPALLKAQIKEKIAANYDFTVPVQVWPLADWERVQRNNPFLSFCESDLSKLHVTFLAQVPDKERISSLETVQYPPEAFMYKDKAIYLHCPNGYGRAKLTNGFWEKFLKVEATTRNWKTVCKLLDMTAQE